MNMLVTGAAGFIGSSLATRLLKEGHVVKGIDCFTDNYPKEKKQLNIKDLLSQPSFTFVEEDLLTCSLSQLFSGIDFCYHQAAQPGVRSSWGTTFDVYIKNNIQATQRILEHVKEKSIKIIFASTSSVYGDCPLPMHEGQIVKPVSPYGVTKLAAENLCYLYHKNYSVPFTAFRYFTVYGPKQRPDMAFHIFIKAILKGEEIQVFGDGHQTRDFTYIDDVVEANLSALDTHRCPGEVFNLGGGSQASVREAISIIEDITGLKPKIKYKDSQKGDAKHTCADISKAKQILKYNPRFDLRKGLAEEIAWIHQGM